MGDESEEFSAVRIDATSCITQIKTFKHSKIKPALHCTFYFLVCRYSTMKSPTSREEQPVGFTRWRTQTILSGRRKQLLISYSTFSVSLYYSSVRNV